MASPPLNELIYGLFYDIFKRAAYIDFNMDQLDKLRQTTDKIVKAIQDEMKDGLKKLAVITIKEMQDMEKRLTNGSKNTKEVADS